MKNKTSILLLFLAIIGNVMADNHQSDSRIIYSINDNWEFCYSDTDNKLTDISNECWKNINIPHTWNINDAVNDTSKYNRGIGLYTKNLKISNELKTKHIFLHFEGANQVTHLFVNDKKVGEHIGGYSAFSFDITEFVKFDGNDNNNKITVKVDNRFNENIAPLSADFTFYGGIYRDVWLVATNPVHFSMSDYGSKAIYVSTPDVSDESALAVISGKIQNQSNSNIKIKILSTVYDVNDEVVTQVSKKVKIKANTNIEFELDKIIVKNPDLWSPDNPNLYSVKTEIFDGDKLLDLVTVTFGFRYYHFDAAKGFFLNGKHLKLIGTNRHQDYEGIGNAMPDQLHVKDVEMIKEAGFNFLRLAHYPQDPSVLEAADKLGLIVWEEIPVVNYVTTTEEFLNNSKMMLIEMIRQHYNHPSIIFWGYMNEVYLHDANGNREKEMYFPDEYLEWTKYFSHELNNLSHKEDNSRLTAIATHQNNLYDETGISNIPDIVGYNLYQGWYSSKFSHFGSFLDRTHAKYPERKIIISEYGAGSDERLHAVEPVRFDFTTEYQQSFHESFLNQIVERPFVGGSSVWCQSDFGSNRRGDSKPQINQKGLQYFNREPKDIYFYYQAVLSDEPIIHIASHDWKTRVSNNQNSTHLIKIYSNTPKVEVFVDGEFAETIVVDDANIAQFEFKPTNCEHNIEVRGIANGKTVSDDVTISFINPSSFVLNNNCSQNLIAVNVGAGSQFTDENGIIWTNDQQYNNNSWGFVSDSTAQKKFTKSIIGSNSDPIFQHYREGVEEYRFDVEDGLYEVDIYFAELEYKKPTERIMDISINNNVVWHNLDLAKEYGQQTAVNRKFIVKVDNNQGISINLKAIAGNSILAGIIIKKQN